MRIIQLFPCIFLMLSALSASAGQKSPLLLAYFIPSDREVIPGHVDRLDRIMTEVQNFYRKGMEAAGYGASTFDLERDAHGKVIVHVVKASHSMRFYGRDDSGKVRDEVRAALSARGIDPDVRTMVIFQVLLEWQGPKAIEVGPYVGGGTHLSGTAWVYDDPLLDPRMLGSTKPGGYYMKPCSIGEFNSHYIGGVAHELGHAFGLPHVAGPNSMLQHSLMGDGNHTYGEELRGKGRGTYLHPASAMLLARAKPFAGSLEGDHSRTRSELAELRVTFSSGQLKVEGQAESAPAVFGVIAYNDQAAIPADYDATGWTSPVDSQGRFRLLIGDLQPGEYELRLQLCHTNGASSTTAFQYRVDGDGRPDLTPFSESNLILSRAARAYAIGSKDRARTLLEEFEKVVGQSEHPLERKAGHLRHLLKPEPVRALAAVPATESRVGISGLDFVEARVGWGTALRDQVLSEEGSPCFLMVGDTFFERGLFAHAPSRYVLDLGGGWKRLSSGFGVQDGHEGSVAFVVRSEKGEIFRSPKIKDHQLRNLELDVTGVKSLELIVEDAGDGASSDWGVWVNPVISR